MYKNRKVVVVMPAYNAARTLEKTHAEVMEQGIVDEIILVDDASVDGTSRIAQTLARTTVHTHARNRGYGGNQKTCYTLALATGADIVVMLHPDYQYEPRLLPALAHMVASGVYEVAIGSRILGKGARTGGMPLYKYVANRALTLAENLLIGQKLSEYHTGYRAFSRRVLETLPLLANSDDFVFDNQMLVQCHHWGFRIAEISCPTKYFPEASSINFRRSVRYGFGTLGVGLAQALTRIGLPAPLYLNKDTAAEYRLSRDTVSLRVADTNVLST
jgi:glycosyltransferase involved in cell wall biosynthesis